MEVEIIVSSSREGFTVRILRSGSAVPAGVGFVVDDRHIVTCAHVVNSALGRDKRTQDKPSSTVRIDVDFPLLGAPDAPMRGCRVEAWVPPPEAGISGSDLAGLELIGEALPKGSGPARLTERASRRDPAVEVFGYPDDPPRHDQGAWSALHLRGTVGGGLLQIDSDMQSAIRAQPGYSGSPVVVEGEASDEVLGMLAVASRSENGKDAYAIPIARLADEWPDVLGALTVPPCPYRGLEAFTVDDAKAGVFVGREEEIGQLRDTIRKQPLVVVTGPSGVGKSSLVNAGLVRVLQDEGWMTRVLRPEGMPFETLAETLAGLDQPDSTPTLAVQEKWVSRLRAGGLAALGSQLSRLRRKPILICLDQFEQILDPGICDPAAKTEFLDLLLHVQPTDRLRLVCTLRADFLSQLLEHPDAGVRLRDRLFTMSPMGLDRMERVITEPAEVRGVRYAPGLAKLIARDGGGGGLPLLGFALTELWPQQRQRQITLADYDGVGGVVGALSSYAERVYGELLERFTEGQIRRVMLALVRSRGGASEATRRLVTRTQLGQDWAGAGALAERRLVVVDHDAAKDEDNVQIAHEALIREWPRFTGWVDDDADYQHWLASLEERAADGDLLPDTRLAEADRWLAERPDGVSQEIRQLIERSKAERDKRIAELNDARSRAQASQQLAEESILQAQESLQQAQESQRQAEARRLAAAAELAIASRGESLQVAIALGIQSLRLAPGFEGDTAIRHALRLAPLLRSRVDHGGPVAAVAFSPDGTKLATGGYTPCIFEAFTGARVCRLFHQHEADMADIRSWREGPHFDRPVFEVTPNGEVRRLARVEAIAFSPDGSLVATASDDHTSRVFSASTGIQVCRLDHSDDVLAVAFSPDGTRIATGSADRTARVFNAATGVEISRLDLGLKVVLVAFSPDGTRIATASGHTACMSDAHDGGLVCSLDHNDDVLAIAVSPDGTQVATGSSDGSARVFDAATGGQTCRLDHGRDVVAVAFSPDGAHVTTGSNDCSARVFDARTGTEMRRLDHEAQVTTVAVSPDGAHVATGSKDGAALVFDASTGAEMWRLDHGLKVGAVAFSPDGTRIATGSGRSARVLDAVTGAQVFLQNHNDDLVAVAFSPDGTRLLTTSVDGRARIFHAVTGAQLSHLDHGWKGNIGAFSLDGTRLAVGRWDGSVLVLEIFTKAEVWRPSADAGLNALALSRDGTKLVTNSVLGAQVIDMAAPAQTSFLRGKMTSFAFSPDGAHVATGNDYGSARIFNASNGEEECHLDHGAQVAAVAFSPDGAYVATGSADHNARVLNAVTGAEMCRLEHGGRVTAVAFSPDGTRLCTGSDDCSVRVWVVDRDRLIEQAEGRLTRDLTQQEWQRFFPGKPYQSTGPSRRKA